MKKYKIRETLFKQFGHRLTGPQINWLCNFIDTQRTTKSKYKYTRKEIYRKLHTHIFNKINSETLMEITNNLLAKLSPEEESQKIMMEQVDKEKKDCLTCFYYDQLKCPECDGNSIGWKSRKQDKPVECDLKEKPSTGKHLGRLLVPEKIEKNQLIERANNRFNPQLITEAEWTLWEKQCEIIDYLISLQKEK